MRFQGEVTRVVKSDVGAGDILLEGFGTRRNEERIVLAPNRQEAGFVLPEVRLESGVERNIALVVTKQIQLLWPRCLELGVDVVLDLGFWSRKERDQVKARARARGADVLLYRLNCP